jgi:LysR family transcriptional regulator, transcriptional activator of the cysJI operon
MDFNQLESFIAVVDCNSFSGAAERMFVSQPTISSHIRSLEEELNTCLIHRTTKTITITEAGHQLYDYASHIMKLRDKILKAFTKTESQVISIGASTIPSTYLLPALIAAFRKANPSITFKIWQGGSIQVLNRLLDGSLDVGFVGTTIDDSRCNFYSFYQDEIVIATPASEYFDSFKKMENPVPQLLQEPMILRDDNSGTKREASQILKELAIEPSSMNIVAHINDQEAIRNSIVNGLGISIISNKAVEDLAENGKVLTFPLGSNSYHRNLYIVTSKNRIPFESTGNFIKFAKKYYAK